MITDTKDLPKADFVQDRALAIGDIGYNSDIVEDFKMRPNM